MVRRSAYYFNRELSWLKFNQRVLQEAADMTNPLLERLRFIAIMSSNMDEFFMIRVAGLKHYVEQHVVKRDAANMTPQQQLDSIANLSNRIVDTEYQYLKQLFEELEAYQLSFVAVEALTDIQKKWLEAYFLQNVYPVVTPLAVDASHPFPFLANRTINAVVKLRKKDLEEEQVAILPLPSVLDRIIEIPKEGEKRLFVYLEDVILYFASHFFLGYTIEDAMLFRVTRDADLELSDDGAEDLLRAMERSLRRRRRGMVVRLEVAVKEEKADSPLLGFIMHHLQIREEDVFRIAGPLDTRMFFSFIDKVDYEFLKYPVFTPCLPQDLVGAPRDIFAAIREKDIFLHHPYESFDTVIQFIEQAAQDPRVLAIKQTLYRVSSDSPIIAALARAADKGKQVTVLMEVKARFDEENNIIMARRLEKAGCHVIYGLVGLKTHSKITMVVRRDEDGIRRYVHLATGNYNGSTAKIYTDCGILTCHEAYGEDASAFFNLISGYSDPPEWSTFGVAPFNLREKIVRAIDQEIMRAKRGERGYIIIKVNALLDEGIIEKLYQASEAGVEIELIIRGICTLRPGMTDVSENITVRSIIGRYLEHHRIYYFYNGGEETIYISSADLMPRNLNDRVELLVPIQEVRHKKRIKDILAVYLSDYKKAHFMRSDGTYYKKEAKGTQSAHDRLSEEAEQKSICMDFLV